MIALYSLVTFSYPHLCPSGSHDILMLPSLMITQCSILIFSCHHMGAAAARGSYCPEGSRNASGSPCPAGSYCYGGSCMPLTCVPGYYCPQGTSDPIPCTGESLAEVESFIYTTQSQRACSEGLPHEQQNTLAVSHIKTHDMSHQTSILGWIDERP